VGWVPSKREPSARMMANREPEAMAGAKVTKPLVQAVLPGIIPSTLLGVVKPLIGLHQAGRLRARIVLEGSASPRDLLEADLVVFCRNLEPQYAWQADLARARRLPYVYVLDDNLFIVPGDSAAGLYHQEPSRLLQLQRYISGASLVTVFSHHLATRLRPLNPRVHVLAGYVDFGLIRGARPRPQTAPVKIVYATSRFNDRLARLFLGDLGRVLDDPRLKTEAYFWGYYPEELGRHPRVHFIDYTADYDSFLSRFSRAGFDIGLAPLLDDEFHRSKSNNKFREYSACGVAGVYSNVNVYSECVDPGVTGILVESGPGAWYEAIARLVQDPSLRYGIQARARQFAVEHYSLDAGQEVWWEQIQNVLSESGHQPRTVLPSLDIAHWVAGASPAEKTPPTVRSAFAMARHTLGSMRSRLRSTSPDRALATIRRTYSQRLVLVKLQLATSPLASMVGRAWRRKK